MPALGKNFHVKSKKVFYFYFFKRLLNPPKPGGKCSFVVTTSFQIGSVCKGGAVKTVWLLKKKKKKKAVASWIPSTIGWSI